MEPCGLQAGRRRERCQGVVRKRTGRRPNVLAWARWSQRRCASIRG
jgi:hypothetical protein